MDISFPPFDNFIKQKAGFQVGEVSNNLEILDIKISKRQITAVVHDQDTTIYQVLIKFDQRQVHQANCSCSPNPKEVCQHIIETLKKATPSIAQRNKSISQTNRTNLFNLYEELVYQHTSSGFLIKNKDVLDFSVSNIQDLSGGLPPPNWLFDLIDFAPNSLQIIITIPDYSAMDSPVIRLQQKEKDIFVSCSCAQAGPEPCLHIGGAILFIQRSRECQLAFNREKRITLIRKNLQSATYKKLSDDKLEELFHLEIERNRVYIEPKINLLSINESTKRELKKSLLPEFEFPKNEKDPLQQFVVMQESNYGSFYYPQLMEAPLTKSGKIKSPIRQVNITQEISNHEDKEIILFYSSFFGQHDFEYDGVQTKQYNQVLNNPLDLPFYVSHENMINAKLTPKKLKPISIQQVRPKATIKVKNEGDFYRLSCQIKLKNKKISTQNILLKDRFILRNNILYYLNDQAIYNCLNFFKKNRDLVYIFSDEFDTFKQEILTPLGEFIEINYDFIKKASKKLIRQKALDQIADRMIYLTESDDWILITPIVTYGEIEVPILSKRTIHTTDSKGKTVVVERNEKKELQFLRQVQRQHQNFEEYPQTDFFYLHKQTFLDEEWFLEAFEAWRKEGIEILGFRQLKKNRYNPHKANIQIGVSSGIDWFDVDAKVSFGKEKASLQALQQSIINKTHYVKLGDGSLGILPQEWIEKFSSYFRNGAINEEKIRTHKSNFQFIDQLFDKEVLDQETQQEISFYKAQLEKFEAIESIKIPQGLQAELRSYQKQGLNWLHFLDQFGFGGILADDMGLGKTIQLIAYFLTQLEKGNTEPNLVVVPTSLLFNWKNEIDKFAPQLKYTIWYGPNRKTKNTQLPHYDVVLTTYGTMLSDIDWLSQTTFNVIVLDESQAIKNPASKRYKAARLLKGRQKLAATGTPIENNTFDLYAQLSFVMPGLLGNRREFKDDYSTPIDKFQDDRRAEELQRKVHPFILRRTKKQVAQELPEKTEMIITCAMNEIQRKLYDSYKTEFQKYLNGVSEEELQKSSLHILQGLTKLRQICNSPALLADQEYYGNESSKLDELLYQIKKLKGEHKILVFSQFVGMLDLIKRRLTQEDISYAYLTGQTRNRKEAVESFQEDEEVRVFLISLKAGGTGLNLTKADYVFIVDPWWNPAVENQAIDRAYRIGQDKHVIAIRLIVPNTIEEKILQLQKRKLKLVEDLIITDQKSFKHLNKEDLLQLV